MSFVKNKTTWIYLGAVLTVVFLGYAIMFRPPVQLPPERYDQLPPDSAIKVFLNDEMDYRTDFSEHLVEKRIERLRDIALIYPEKKAKAERVIDTLQARLERGAVTKKEAEE